MPDKSFLGRFQLNAAQSRASPEMPRAEGAGAFVNAFLGGAVITFVGDASCIAGFSITVMRWIR
jgi:hypothetical protein